MAKRLITWTLDQTILKASRVVEDKKAEVIFTAEFDLIELFKDFAEYTDVQKQLVVYGVKQKLADAGASEIADYDSKIAKAKAKWAELLEGKWTGSRVNATGAAENRKLLNNIKETAKVVSLEGLMLKKAMAKFPGQEAFTEADEAKLQEFLAMVAEKSK